MSWDKFYKSIQEAYHIEDEATVIKIPFENIIEITSEELVFKNDYGNTEKINLNECAQNYDLAQGISPEQREGRLKCIGGRCFPFFWIFHIHSPYKIFHTIKENGIHAIFEKDRLGSVLKGAFKILCLSKEA